jgi:hypothetical protein
MRRLYLMRCLVRWRQALESGRNTAVATLLRMGEVLKVPAWNLLRILNGSFLVKAQSI